MTPLLNTAIVVGAGLVIAIGIIHALAYIAVSRVTEDSTDLDADWE